MKRAKLCGGGSRGLWTWGRHFQLVCGKLLFLQLICIINRLFHYIFSYYLQNWGWNLPAVFLWEYADYSFGCFSEVMDTHSKISHNSSCQSKRNSRERSPKRLKLKMLSVSVLQLMFSPTGYLSGLYFSVLAASSVELVNSHSLMAEQQAAGQWASVQVYVVQSSAIHVEVFGRS